MQASFQQNPPHRDHDEITFTPPSPGKTLEWITVLSAAGLEYRLSHEKGTWLLHVSANESDHAWAEISAYEKEPLPPMAPPPLAPPPHQAHTALWYAFWLAYTLVWFYIWLGPFDASLPLHRAGAAGGILFREGGWWRNITALTLHADLPHLAANVLFLFCIGQAVIREIGPGVGLALMLAASILGNLVAARVASPFQLSVGASTMAFAALGIMSACQSMRLHNSYNRWNPIWKRAWIPLAAGLAMLGITGSGPHSDLFAHLFGFGAGLLLAIPFALARKRIADCPRFLQWTATVLTLTLPILAWFLAFQNSTVPL